MSDAIPAREIIDRVRASREEASARLAQQRMVEEEAIQLELSTLEQFARLTEAVEEAGQRYQSTISRMDAAAKPYEIKDAARHIYNNTEQLHVIIGKLADAECLNKRRVKILREVKRLSIDDAEARLAAFKKENSASLKKH